MGVVRESVKLVARNLPVIGRLMRQREELLQQLRKFDDSLRFFERAGYEVTEELDGGVTVKSSTLAITGKSKNNTLFTAREVLLVGQYDFFGVKNEPWIVFDVGMNIGITALHLAVEKKVKKIYGFEPFLPTYELAKNNLQSNPRWARKIRAYNFGLGGEGEEVVVRYNSGLPGSMSTTRDVFAEVEGLDEERVVVKKASKILLPLIKKHQKEGRFFLKLDCEGAEGEILSDLAKTKLLNKITVVIVEYHQGNNDRELVKILMQAGFFCFIERMLSDNGAGLGVIKAVRV